MTARLTGWTSFASDVREEVRHQSPDHIARLVWDGAQIEAAQREGLTGLLAHAVSIPRSTESASAGSTWTASTPGTCPPSR